MSCQRAGYHVIFLQIIILLTLLKYVSSLPPLALYSQIYYMEPSRYFKNPHHCQQLKGFEMSDISLIFFVNLRTVALLLFFQRHRNIKVQPHKYAC